jgi:hypothetical protein
MTSTDSSITNFSKIKANNTINLTAAKDITNTATILTNDSNLLASNNNGVSSYITNGAEESNKNNKNISSEILETASIKGGSVSINAGNNFNNFAANIDTSKNIINQSAIDQAKAHNKKVIETGIGEVIAIPSPIYSSGNLTLTADNDINISTLALRNRTETTWGNRKKGGTDIVDITTNIGSNINIDGSLTATTTGLGLASEQKEIDALNAKIQAKYDEDMLAYNIALEKYQKSLTYIPILKESISPQSPPTKPEDPIFYKQATSNINIIGSNITTKEDLNLAAKDNVNIISAQDSYHKEERSHKNGTTVKKTYFATTDNITNISSNLISDGNINISSGKDTNIIASNITGKGNGDIITGAYIDYDINSATYGQTLFNNDANLNIANAVDSKRFYSESTKTKTGLSLENAAMTAAMVAAVVATGGAGTAALATTGGMTAVGVGAAAGSINKQKNTKTELRYDETVVASKLSFNNNLTLSSVNNATIKSSNIKAGGNITVNTGNNLIIATASENHLHSIETKNKGNYFFKNGQYGNYDSNIINTEITSNTSSDIVNSNLTFNVGNIAIVEYNKASKTSDDDNANNVVNIANITTANTNTTSTTNIANTIKAGSDNSTLYRNYSQNSKLAYINKLDSLNTLYNPVEEIHKSWNQTNRGLTKTGQIAMAVTAVAISITTGGIGSGISGAMTTAAATTASTTATISATNASMNSTGLTDTLKYSLDSAYKSTKSKDNIKNMAIAAGVAGVGYGIGEWMKTKGVNPSFESGTMDNNRVGVNVEKGTDGNWYQKLPNKERVQVSSFEAHTIGNQNPAFKALNTTPGAPAFANFHDAMNFPFGVNQVTIAPYYAMSQCAASPTLCATFPDTFIKIGTWGQVDTNLNSYKNYEKNN